MRRSSSAVTTCSAVNGERSLRRARHHRSMQGCLQPLISFAICDADGAVSVGSRQLPVMTLPLLRWASVGISASSDGSGDKVERFRDDFRIRLISTNCFNASRCAMLNVTLDLSSGLPSPFPAP